MPFAIARRIMLAAGAASLFTPYVARAATRSVKLGQASGPDSPSGRGCRGLAAAVAAHPLLQSVISIDVRDNGLLGDDAAMLKGCIVGALDLALVGSTVTSGVCPEVGLMDTPFLFSSVAAARAVLDGSIGGELAALAKEKGVNIVGWGENGLRHITANRPIRQPSDLLGLKLRVPPSEVMRTSFAALGADVRTVAYLQLHEALRTGEVEAQENPIGLIESSKLYDVQKYLCLTAHIYSCSLFVASPDLLEDLSPPQANALVECARRGTAVSRETADIDEKGGAERLHGQGMTIVSDVDGQAFLAANHPNLAAVGAKISPALMDRMIKAGAGV